MGATIQNAGYKKKAKKNIVETAVATESLSTLVAAVKAADLVGTLSGEGPFTVFAPVNDAFAALPAGTVETLLKPENKAQLTGILTAHVVAGKLKAKDIVKLAKENGGSVSVETVSGDTLTAVLNGDTLTVRDENGGVAGVALADVKTSNGVVHVVDSVLLPIQGKS
ncbi:fasciclin domain-containing protein [Fretibacter rubidus]|uniref:fasciclin domain-containing protein n=1 Tax=Fretibacter rubidus TaxID=570162 RepID=UPI00352AA80B